MANAEPDTTPSERRLQPATESGIVSGTSVRAPSNDPFTRVMHVGDGASLVVAIAIGASIVLHSALALAAYIRDLNVTPQQPTCHAGETVQLEAFARSAWNSTLRVTTSAKWSVGNDKLLSHAGGGFFRCVSEGTTDVTVSYLNRTATLPVKVEPALVMVDVKEEPPPPPPPAPEPEPAPVPQAPAAPPEAKPTQEPPPPAAAKAGHLLTADDNAPKTGDEPESFVTDPNGNEYGSGNVAKGGTADVSTSPKAAASGVGTGGGNGNSKQGPPSTASTMTAASDLSRKPSLPPGYGCKNFPADADDDFAVVQVLVTVKPSGEVSNVTVMDEKPKGQGFGKAARTCVSSVKLTPALDKAGNPTGTSVTMRLTFNR